MPQAIPLVATIIATIAGAPQILAAFIGLAASAVASLLTPEAKAPSIAQNGHLINTRSMQDPLPIVYGQVKIGGTQVFITTTGDNNKYLHIIQTLCEGEIEGLVHVYLDDKLISTYGGDAYYEFFKGTPTQNVCATLHSAYPDWTDAMRNTAYLYVRLTYNTDKFAALPVITAVIQGKKVYDPRNDTTAYSTNPAVCTYDYVRNTRYGVGIPGGFWNESSISTVANWCDTKGYTLNGILLDQNTAIDVIYNLLMCFRSGIIWSGGQFKLISFDYDAPVMTFNEDEIKENSFRINVPTIQDLPNTLKITYINKDNYYISDPFDLPDPNAVNIDGEKRVQELLLLGIDNRQQAQKIGTYTIERQRLNYIYSFVAGPKAIPLEPGDMIQVTHSLPGWVDKIVRVKDCQILSETEVALALLDEDALLYDDIINLETQATYSTSLPDPLGTPPQVEDVQFTEEIYSIKDNSYSRVKGTWAVPEGYNFLKHVEIWVSRDDVTYIHHTDSVGSFTLEPAKDGELWYFKFIPVSIYEVKRTLATVTTYNYTVTGKTSLPSNVSGFMASVAGDTVNLRWDKVSDEDLLGYEIRYGSAWNTSIFLGFTKALNVPLVGVKPGTHSFCIKAKDTLYNYSQNASVCTITVFDPPNYMEKNSFYNDFTSGGTFNNMETVVDPTYGRILRVIHSGGLSGDYTSPVYDMTSIKKCRHWLNYDTVINSTGATWQGGIGDVVWTTALQSGETWVQQFSNVQAGILTMKFFYSEDNSTWYEINNFQILSCEVQARYLKYQIFITDNDANSYIYVKPCTEKAFYWQ